MPTIIKLAKTTDELKDVMHVRYRSMKEKKREPHHIYNQTEMLSDHFDVYPNTLNIVAYYQGEAVATLRALVYSNSEKVLNFIFDYRDAHKQIGEGCYIIDMLAILDSCDYKDVVLEQLFKVLMNILGHRNAKKIFFNCPKGLYPFFEHYSHVKLADEFNHLNYNNITPCSFDVKDFYNTFVSAVSDREILRFQEVFYNVIFGPGEILVVQGEKGASAYLIEGGTVEVLIQTDDGILPVSEIGPGNLIGEIAMVTSEVRTASIMAKTVTTCIAFDRDDFMNIMYENPNKAMDIFKIFSKRLSASNKKIAELSRK